MPPEKIQITDDDIKYAESVLLDEDQYFDPERADFIKNLNTIDLHAVPGSGKTTVLLAKLLIIEKHLPFKDGSGILVISHTNAAVDEITKRIGKYTPKLFSYPNFVGTIQSFVDRFLAIPYYSTKYKKKIYRIDNEIYDENFIKIFPKRLNYGLKQRFMEKYLEFIKSFHLDSNDKIKCNFSERAFPYKNNPPSSTYIELKKTKNELVKRGILHYDDAYILAYDYISIYPLINRLLQQRFSYVFVDEMQDMDKHQHDLLEMLFENKYNIFQRIGDKNQAIYYKVKSENIWSDRKKKLTLKGSHRLTPPIAKVVKYFGLEYSEIEAINNKTDIKPHIIIYDNDSVEDVIPEFAKLVNKYQDQDKIPHCLSYPIKAIGWRKEHADKDKFCINRYFPDFESNEHIPKTNYPNLKYYLLYYEKKAEKSLRYIRKGLLYAFLRVMLLENILDDEDRFFTIPKLIYYLKNMEDKSIYEDFKLKIYLWSRLIYQGSIKDVYDEIKEYLPEFIKYFNSSRKIDRSQDFIDSPEVPIEESTESSNLNRKNIKEYSGICVEISTIHSVKGETHTATLYMECYYQRKYESETLKDCICGKNHNFSNKENEDVHKKESIKMAYVGFSRPTHLLCFAVHKDRLLDRESISNWEIVEV